MSKLSSFRVAVSFPNGDLSQLKRVSVDTNVSLVRVVGTLWLDKGLADLVKASDLLGCQLTLSHDMTKLTFVSNNLTVALAQLKNWLEANFYSTTS